MPLSNYVYQWKIFGPVFIWNSSADDQDLEDYLSRFSPSIDEETSPPVLSWTSTSQSGSFELTPGCAINTGISIPGLVVLPDGSFTSDQYGRPFNLNDIVAQ